MLGLKLNDVSRMAPGADPAQIKYRHLKFNYNTHLSMKFEFQTFPTVYIAYEEYL